MRRELLLGLLVAWLAAPATDARAQQKKFEIAAIEAKLFYSNTGRFSSNIVGKPKFVLHNVVAGEGSAEGPSESTLLIVRLQGPPRGFLKELRKRRIPGNHDAASLIRALKAPRFRRFRDQIPRRRPWKRRSPRRNRERNPMSQKRSPRIALRGL